MASIAIIFMCALFTLASAELRTYPEDAEVAEGTWASFTCSIKLPGTIYWRIGSVAHAEHTFYGLDEFEGVRAKENNIKVSGRKLSETIEILATTELDGTPVECKWESPRGEHEYSPFALLKVYPAVDSESEEGSGTAGSGAGSVANNIRGLRSVLDSEVSPTDMTSGESQCAIMASLSVMLCSLIATLARF